MFSVHNDAKNLLLLTVVVVLLKVLVDNTTVDDIAHVGRVESSRLLKDTGGSSVGQVATILGEEDGDRIILVVVDEAVVSRRLKVALAAPRVNVVAKEVDGLLLGVAVEEAGQSIANVLVVVGGISNAHGAVALALDVLLHVSHSRLDIGRGAGVVGLVADFIARKEADDVGVVGQGVNDLGVVLVELHVPLGAVAVDGQAGLTEVGDDVDAGILQQLHAGGVIGIRVDGVGADDVGAQLLEEGHVTLANSLIAEGINKGCVG